MTELIQSAKSGHGPPGTISSETGSPQVARHCHELGERYSRSVYLQSIDPGGSQLLYILQPPDRVAYRVYGTVFLILVVHVLAVGGLEGLLPILPLRVGQPRATTDHFRKDLFLPHVGVIPVQLPRQVQPLFPLEHVIPLFYAGLLTLPIVPQSAREVVTKGCNFGVILVRIASWGYRYHFSSHLFVLTYATNSSYVGRTP